MQPLIRDRYLMDTAPCAREQPFFGAYVAKLIWPDSVDHLELHVLRAAKLLPLDQYFATRVLPMDVVYYIVALIAHATKTHDVKDLGFYNFAVKTDGPDADVAMTILLLDAADWIP